MCPNLSIGSIPQTNIRNMGCFCPEINGDESSESRGELVIDKEFHADNRTE